jgi:hypothetical protein
MSSSAEGHAWLQGTPLDVLPWQMSVASLLLGTALVIAGIAIVILDRNRN